MSLPLKLAVNSVKLPEKSNPPKIAAIIGKKSSNKSLGNIFVRSMQNLHCCFLNCIQNRTETNLY